MALVFGLTVAAVIAVVAPISGAHLNPATTLALWFSGRFPVRQVLPYILAQLVGAVLAGLLLRSLFGLGGEVGITEPAGSVAQAFVLEAVMTLILPLAALRSGLPWVVGGVVGLEAMMGGPFTGASMNPARSFGPALASGVWTAHWLYGVAPLLGAVLAVGLNHLLALPARTLEPQPSRAREFTPIKETS